MALGKQMPRRGVPLSRVSQLIPICRRFPALDCRPLLKALCRKPLVYDAAILGDGSKAIGLRAQVQESLRRFVKPYPRLCLRRVNVASDASFGAHGAPIE